MSLFYLTNLLHLNCKSVVTKKAALCNFGRLQVGLIKLML